MAGDVDGAKAAEALGVLDDTAYDLAMAAGRLVILVEAVPGSAVKNARQEVLDSLRAFKDRRAEALKTLQDWRVLHP